MDLSIATLVITRLANYSVLVSKPQLKKRISRGDHQDLGGIRKPF